jgi:aminoglycoside phosphotransferase (APT) family kinase protein
MPVIDEQLAHRLVSDQFPEWADLPLGPLETGGNDNRTFRLGQELAVRLPSHSEYAAQVDKEHRWLPRLAPRLPLEIPKPVAKGVPTAGYGFPWSVYSWIDGEAACEATIGDLSEFAVTLAEFLVALHRIDPAGGPAPGAHNFHRGGPLGTYGDETLQAIDVLAAEIPEPAVREAWDDALATGWEHDPVWLHGDLTADNLLVREGRLRAVIDFGLCAVGDPACDLAIAWTLFEGESRDAFRALVGWDSATWSRGRGWALWKALITLAERDGHTPEEAARSRRTIERIAADRARG